MYVWHAHNIGDVCLFVCPSGRTTIYKGSYHLNDVECFSDMQKKIGPCQTRYKASTSVPSKHYNGMLLVPG